MARAERERSNRWEQDDDFEEIYPEERNHRRDGQRKRPREGDVHGTDEDTQRPLRTHMRDVRTGRSDGPPGKRMHTGRPARPGPGPNVAYSVKLSNLPREYVHNDIAKLHEGMGLDPVKLESSRFVDGRDSEETGVAFLRFPDKSTAEEAANAMRHKEVTGTDGQVYTLLADVKESAGVSEIHPSVYISDLPLEYDEDKIMEIHREVDPSFSETLVTVKLLASRDPNGETRCCITRYRDEPSAQRAIDGLKGRRQQLKSGNWKYLGIKHAKPAEWMVKIGAADRQTQAWLENKNQLDEFRRERETKATEKLPENKRVKGEVASWKEERGFGFLRPAEFPSNKVFVHRKTLQDAQYLEVNSEVTFECRYDEDRQSYNVTACWTGNPDAQAGDQWGGKGDWGKGDWGKGDWGRGDWGKGDWGKGWGKGDWAKGDSSGKGGKNAPTAPASEELRNFASQINLNEESVAWLAALPVEAQKATFDAFSLESLQVEGVDIDTRVRNTAWSIYQQGSWMWPPLQGGPPSPPPPVRVNENPTGLPLPADTWISGRVDRWNDMSGFGFATATESGHTVFIGKRALTGYGFSTWQPQVGSSVAFKAVLNTDKGNYTATECVDGSQLSGMGIVIPPPQTADLSQQLAIVQAVSQQDWQNAFAQNWPDASQSGMDWQSVTAGGASLQNSGAQAADWQTGSSWNCAGGQTWPNWPPNEDSNKLDAQWFQQQAQEAKPAEPQETHEPCVEMNTLAGERDLDLPTVEWLCTMKPEKQKYIIDHFMTKLKVTRQTEVWIPTEQIGVELRQIDEVIKERERAKGVVDRRQGEKQHDVTRVLIRNLPPKVTKAEVQDLLCGIGSMKSCWLSPATVHDASAVVCMGSAIEAKNAIDDHAALRTDAVTEQVSIKALPGDMHPSTATKTLLFHGLPLEFTEEFLQVLLMPFTVVGKIEIFEPGSASKGARVTVAGEDDAHLIVLCLHTKEVEGAPEKLAVFFETSEQLADQETVSPATERGVWRPSSYSDGDKPPDVNGSEWDGNNWDEHGDREFSGRKGSGRANRQVQNPRRSSWKDDQCHQFAPSGGSWSESSKRSRFDEGRHLPRLQEGDFSEYPDEAQTARPRRDGGGRGGIGRSRSDFDGGSGNQRAKDVPWHSGKGSRRR